MIFNKINGYYINTNYSIALGHSNIIIEDTNVLNYINKPVERSFRHV